MVADPSVEAALRLDKWLWSARFFKTRALAATAIKSGKVELNGQRTKPSKPVQVDDQLCIRRGPYRFQVTVRGLSAQRRSASEAAALYLETEQSVRAREALALQLSSAAAGQPRSQGRPSKRDRRDLLRFTGRRKD